MKTTNLLRMSALAGVLIAGAGAANAGMIVTQDSNGTNLLNALVPNQSQFNSISASFTTGNAAQVGTYTGFTSPPVTIGNGVVLSTGNAVDVVGPANASDVPSTDFSGGSTTEINNYASGRVIGWNSSFDAAVLSVNFNLASASAIAFNFVFGSIEFPNYVNQFADASFAFLDGTQIIFDSAGNPVDVGTSFANLLTKVDTNTAFADPHALLDTLTTTSGTLAAGDHTLLFEIADTNDGILDSAIFLSNFRTTTNSGGPVTQPEDVPEPASLSLLLAGLTALGFIRFGAGRRKFAVVRVSA